MSLARSVHTFYLSPQPTLLSRLCSQLQFFGSTSRFHTRPLPNGIGPKPQPSEDYHRKFLLSNSRFYASWERLAYDKLLKSSDVDPDSAFTLLSIYWTWQAPLHNAVYKPCESASERRPLAVDGSLTTSGFYRDMALDGPYFSPFLLNVTYAHACRHTKPDDVRFSSYAQGEHFLDKAKLLLVDEIGRHKPRIPTIQGLIILGGRQCAVGKHSEGYLFTSMVCTTHTLRLHGTHIVLSGPGHVERPWSTSSPAERVIARESRAG